MGKLQKQPKPIAAPPEEVKGWALNTDEVMRDINSVIKQCIDQMQKLNQFGLENIGIGDAPNSSTLFRYRRRPR